MKTRFVTALLFFGLYTATAQEFSFETETINYGKIIKGANGKRVFTFTNTGDNPLVITSVKSSCGCTIPKKPTQPIAPGKKGRIEVAYDTNRIGGFSKSITILSNAKTSRKVIRIKGVVQKVALPEKEKNMLQNNS